MIGIKQLRNNIKTLNEIEEKTKIHKNNKSKPKNKEILFFPLMDIKNKFKISKIFDEKNSAKLLEEKDKYLEEVELDDKLPEGSPTYKITKIDPLNITFGI